MPFVDQEWIQRTLVERNDVWCLEKIVDIQSSNAVEEGNNYVGDILRLKIKFISKEGEIQERSVIYKKLPTTENKISNKTAMLLFDNEIMVYTKALKQMIKLFRRKDPECDMLWPHFYGVKGENEGYLMEDLSVDGYKMVDRKKELDFDHLRVSIESLAKYHAGGAVLLERGKIEEKDFLNAPFFVKDDVVLRRLLQRPMTAIPRLIENNWPSEWHEYAEKVRNMDSTFIPKLMKVFDMNEYSFITLNHGDCWSNNILFKYDSNGSPLKIKFVDFQLPFIHSPCFDLHYLLSANMKLELLGRRNELLRIYHDALERYLQLFEYAKMIPTFENIMKDFDKSKAFGFLVSIALKAVFLNPSFLELAAKFNVSDENEKWILPYLYDGEYYFKILSKSLKLMNECGYFESIDGIIDT